MSGAREGSHASMHAPGRGQPPHVDLADEPSPFSPELRRLRVRAGLTQEQLAERAGVSVATIGALEEGVRRRPYPNTLRALAEALDLQSDERTAFIDAVSGSGGGGSPRAGRGSPGGERSAPVGSDDHLPSVPTLLIGRQAEIAAACALLVPPAPRTRLLTLAGPGGVGKTRLALAIAEGLIDHYPDGVVFVDLASIRDERLVPATIARALDLGLAGGRSAWELVLMHFRQRQALLVLDNFEHLLGAAPLLPELLAACPRLALVVTSRSSLRLRGEQRFPVRPLATPRDQPHLSLETVAACPAVQLFVDRAQAVVPDFTLDQHNMAAVAGVCRQVEGMPLGLELAAARLVLLRPEALLQRLERRLPLLTGGLRDQPARQRTLRDTLAWSHDLLGPAERVLFRRLAAFARGGPLEAIETVCADAALPAEGLLEVLQALQESSLIQVQRNAAGPRFGMLELVREYAEECLAASGEAETIRSRHRDWYLAWAERTLPELTGPGQAEGFGRLTEELDNLRAARAWSHQDPRGAEAELRLVAALGRYWNTCAPGREARAWLSEALERETGRAVAARAAALVWSGQLEYIHGQPETSEARLREAVAVARQQADPRVLTTALRHLALYSSDLAGAPRLLEEAASVARRAGDLRELALALMFLGIVPERAGDVAAAERLYTEALEAARQSGDGSAVANVLLRLGELSLGRGQQAEAAAWLNEAEQLSESIGYRMHLEKANRRLAQWALNEGQLDEAMRRIGASLELVRDSGREGDGLWPLRVAARVVASRRELGRALQLFAAEASLRARHLRHAATLWTLSEAPSSDEDLSGLRAALGEDAFAAAWATGSALGLDDAIAVALGAVRAAAPGHSPQVPAERTQSL